LHFDGVLAAQSFENAIEIAALENKEIMVIGGTQLYQQALNIAGRIYMTRVHAKVEGDVTFPELPTSQWKEDVVSSHYKDDKNSFDHDIVVLNRIYAD
jgi:dihydrofolate reductase